MASAATALTLVALVSCGASIGSRPAASSSRQTGGATVSSSPDIDVSVIAGCVADQIYRSGPISSAVLYRPSHEAIQNVLRTLGPWEDPAYVVVARGTFTSAAGPSQQPSGSVQAIWVLMPKSSLGGKEIGDPICTDAVQAGDWVSVPGLGEFGEGQPIDPTAFPKPPQGSP